MRLYIPDLVSNFAGQIAGASAVVAGVACIRKRAAVFAVCALACVLGSISVASVGRARFVGTQAGLGEFDSAALTVLVFNTQSVGGDQQRTLDCVLSVDADIVALPELSIELADMLEADDRVRAQYPYFWLTGKRVPGRRITLSKFPADELFAGGARTAWAMTPAPGVHAMRVHTPNGDVGVVVIHPLAPKHFKRWGWGNDVVDRAVEVVREARDLGLPIIVAADMNASLTSWRSTVLSQRAGLVRAKPMFAMTGTWPAWSAWPMQIAIDDVWVSPEFGVQSWEALKPSGSDHLPMLVTLRHTQVPK